MASDSDAEELEYEEEEVEVLDQRLRVLTVGELPLTLLATLGQRREEISGRRVWAGSLVLAHYLGNQRREELRASRRMLELGCGSGVAGMALTRALGIEVHLTDGDTKAVELLRRNVALNDLENAITISELYWGNEGSLDAFAKSCELHDESSAYPVVIAGDVLYKRELIGPLLATVRRMLAVGGHFYLCHIPRFNVHHEIVTTALDNDGWTVLETVIVGDGEVLQETEPGSAWDIETIQDGKRARIYCVTPR